MEVGVAMATSFSGGNYQIKTDGTTATVVTRSDPDASVLA